MTLTGLVGSNPTASAKGTNMGQEQSKWKKETTAGGVVYKKQDGRVFILLIMPKGPNFGPPRGFWTFPKGMVEDGEDMKVAAVREVKEEGGVEGQIEEELGYIKYFRNAGNGFGPALKFVHYYLMQYVSGDPKDHDEEIAEADWVPIEEVESKLKFIQDKDIFNLALIKLKAKDETDNG